MSTRIRAFHVGLSLVFAALLLAGGAYGQTTWYVDDDAPGDPGPGDPTVSDPDEDGSAAHPYDAIQEGINAAIGGDTVLVLDGTYSGTGNKNLDFAGNAITVMSENGASACIIDCEGSGRGFLFDDGETAGAVVDGFTVTDGNGSGEHGGAIKCDASSPTVRNCIIAGNSAERGGGVYAEDCGPTLTNCLIIGNTVNLAGGGVHSETTTLTVVNCTIADNDGANGGGGMNVAAGSDVAIANCVLSGNTAAQGPEARVLGGSNPSTVTISYTDVDGGQAEIYVHSACTLNWGDGNIDADPVFADPNNADYHLQPGSPCVDAGMNDPPGGLPPDDLDGNLRPIDGDGDVEPWTGQAETADMGAYESGVQTDTLICLAPLEFTFLAPEGGPDPDDQTLSIWNCGVGTLNWEIVEACSWLTVDPNSGDSTGEVDEVTISVDLAGLAVGWHHCTAQIVDPGAANSPQAFDVNLFIYPPGGTALYVDDDAALGGDGLSWGTAFKYLQDALATAPGNPAVTEIRIGGGVYTPDRAEAGGVTPGDRAATFQLLDGITILGGYRGLAGGGDPDERDIAAFETILSGEIGDTGALGDNSRHVVTGSGTDSTAVLDGCTVADGHTQGWDVWDMDGAGVYIISGSPTLRSCTIRDNKTDHGSNEFQLLSGGHGAGVYCDGGSPTFVGCTIRDNQCGVGAGSWCEAGNPVPTTAGGSGGGLFFLNSSPLLVNCAVLNNAGGRGGNGTSCNGWPTSPGADGGNGGGVCLASSSDAVLVNCLLAGNSTRDGGEGGEMPWFGDQGGDAGDGGGVYCCSTSAATLVNCTLVANATGAPGEGDPMGGPGYGGGVRIAAGSGIVTNCILWDNQATTGTTEAQQLSGAAITVDYSCVEGWTGGLGGTGNIGSDPGLRDPDNGDYHLSAGSPCVDAGDNTAIPADEADLDDDGDTTERTPLDLDGLPRFVDDPNTADMGVADPPDYPDVVDMGAYEVDPTLPRICLIPAEFTFIAPVGGPNPDDQTLSIWNCGFAVLNWEVVEECAWLSAAPLSDQSAGEVDEVTLSVDVTGLTRGEYTCQIEVVDPAAGNSPQTVQVTLCVFGGTLHVPSEYPTIQGAIDAAYPGDTVLVADGTYTGTGNKDLDFAGKAITVCSENGPSACIIDCEGDGRGFHLANGETPAATIEGFTITNGHTYAGYGGAIYCRGNRPTIVNCRIVGNFAKCGGGVYLGYGSPRLVNCLMAGNEARYFGGGLQARGSSATLVNCTFVGNNGPTGGGGVQVWEASDVTIANCVFSDNTAPEGPEVRVLGESDPSLLTISYTDIDGGQAEIYVAPGCTLNWGNGMIDADPLFVAAAAGDYHLAAGSPCIDAADTTAVPADSADVDGDGDTSERTPLDLDAMPRFVNDPGTADTGVADPPDYPQVVDMGAYEFGIPCDLDGDCDVDLGDLTQLLSNYGTTSGASYTNGDVDGDGDVDLGDLAALLAVYNTACP